ncbi:hypothetical protein ABZZ04_10145 [Streptomyces sp. NPDC006435]|uniref:hypothetical protein n=1 Tax=Streptomyces sp. NPDC006435 TaxID=3154300 RepID=UPI0033AC0C10
MHKEHAAQVVAVLRAAESRQHVETDTGKVLEDIALILLTITSRYAEGLTAELLGPDRLEGVTPAINFGWARMLLFGAVAIAAGAGCELAGVPAGVATPLVGAVLLLGGRALLGYRLGAVETLDLFRGAK